MLWSGGFCFLLTALFHEIVDVRGWRAWAFPLVVLGTNSIAAYCLYEAALRPITDAVVRHAPLPALAALGPVYGQTAVGALALAVIFAILLWMQARRIFLRI